MNINNMKPTKPSIIHHFTVKLTKQQQVKLHKIWNKHGKNGGAIIMQPVLNWGPFTMKRAFLNAAVVNAECFTQLSNTLETANVHES